MVETKHSFQSDNRIWIVTAVLINIGLGFAAFCLFYLNRNTITPEAWAAAGGVRDGLGDWISISSQTIILPLFGSVVAFVIARNKEVARMGWLLIALLILNAINIFLLEWTVFQFFTRPEPMVGAQIMAWVSNWSWIWIMAALFLLVAIFPNGRFLSRRWQIAVLTALGLFLTFNFGAMLETPMSSAYQLNNPFFLQERRPIYTLFQTIGIFGVMASALMVLIEKIARFRQSQGKVRQQMKWLMAGAILMGILVLAGTILSLLDNVVGEFMVSTSPLSLFLGIGVALWRHQLFDIDLIIRRTLIYSLVSGCLAAVYFITVALIQSTIAVVGGQPSAIVIVISTLLIATLFNPLRKQIQTLIDRRFFRSSYDAQETLTRFAETARDEVEIERLTAVLLQVVQETMQPESVSVWFKPIADSPTSLSSGNRPLTVD